MYLPIPSLHNITNTGVDPLAVLDQYSADKIVKQNIKHHITHDCSFPEPSGHPSNNRVVKELLNTYFYVLYLLRTLHMIVSMSQHWPYYRILIRK